MSDNVRLHTDQTSNVERDAAASILEASLLAHRDDFIVDLRDGDRVVSYLRGMEEETTAPKSRWLRFVRRALDLTSALVALVVLAPVIGLIVLIAKIQGNGPFLFHHERVGRAGKLFACLKFRSMHPDADHRLAELLVTDEDFRTEWLQDHKAKNDPRVTPLGKFLRRTSLDELPQLINVVRGEMSVIGPRPIVAAETVRYGDAMAEVLTVRPGLTGLWQASGRNSLPYDERVALDLRYVREQSLWLDTVVLLKTVRCLITGHGAS